jgi:hypothetical protein
MVGDFSFNGALRGFADTAFFFFRGMSKVQTSRAEAVL